MKIKQKMFSILLMVNMLSFSQVGIGTTTPDPSSVLDVSSAEKGFLLPRMTAAERGAISNPAVGLIIYCTDCNELQLFDGTGWVGLAFREANDPVASGPCAGLSSIIIFNALEYKPIASNGKCWLDRNLGANRVAVSSTDAEAFGDYYQWGRSNDGHQSLSSTAVSAQSNTPIPGPPNTDKFLSGFINWYNGANPNDLWKTDGSGINNPCPSGFRLPTPAEFTTEYQSWSQPNSIGAFSSTLRFAATGYRNYQNGQFINNSIGYLWSSEATNASNGVDYLFFNNNVGFTNNYRSWGLPVRCIRN